MKITFRPPKSVTPDREHGIRVPYAPAKRAVARWRWYLIVLLVAAPLLYLVGQLFYTLVFVKARGPRQPAEDARSTPRSPARWSALRHAPAIAWRRDNYWSC